MLSLFDGRIEKINCEGVPVLPARNFHTGELCGSQRGYAFGITADREGHSLTDFVTDGEI